MANSNTQLLQLALDPVDGLFFRDARPFEPATHAASGLPMPQTLAGAVRTLLLERHKVDFGQLGKLMKKGADFASALSQIANGSAAAVADVRINGPYFTLDDQVLVPMPTNLRQDKENSSLMRLDPLKIPPPGWQPEDPGMLPLWRYNREGADAVEGFLKPNGLRCFLEGGLPDPQDLVPTSALYELDSRTGIGIDPQSNSAAEGSIYGIRMLVLKPKAGLYAEVSGPADALDPLASEPVLMKFGGESKHVVVHRLQQGADWPPVPSEDGKGRLVLLTTPAHFNGWKPPCIKPVAAAVGGHQAVSGWDLAKGGPKPNRFMVPAGSTYFLQPGDLEPNGSLVSNDDAQVGWGKFLVGNWHYV